MTNFKAYKSFHKDHNGITDIGSHSSMPEALYDAHDSFFLYNGKIQGFCYTTVPVTDEELKQDDFTDYEEIK